MTKEQEAMIEEEYVTFEKIPNHEGYGISRDGKVFSYKSNRLLSQKCDRGYLRVSLSHNGVATLYGVHRLVAEMFIPNLENKPFVNHINSDRSDNRVENLEWCTQSENIIHCVKCNRHKGMRERKHTQLTKDKISRAKKGKHHTDEHKEKIRQTCIGRIVSEGTKVKMRKPHKGKTILVLASGKTYSSVSQYERELGIKEWIAYKQIKKGEIIYV